MKPSDKPKLIIAGVVFVAAVVLIAYNLGIFGGSAAPTAAPQLKEGAASQGGGARTAPGAK